MTRDYPLEKVRNFGTPVAKQSLLRGEKCFIRVNTEKND